MVRWPERDLCSATAMTSLISLMPARTALKETNSELVRRAMRRARVVFPQPGGPQKSMEPRLSFSICTRSDLPGPRSFSWPMNSSSVRGRMRSASGWLAAGTSGSGAGGGNFEKRLTLFWAAAKEKPVGCPTRLRSFFGGRLRKKRLLPRRRRSVIRCRWPWEYECAHRRCARLLREDRRPRCRPGEPPAGTNRLPTERAAAGHRDAVRGRSKRACERPRPLAVQEESKATFPRGSEDAEQHRRRRAELSARKDSRCR